MEVLSRKITSVLFVLFLLLVGFSGSVSCGLRAQGYDVRNILTTYFNHLRDLRAIPYNAQDIDRMVRESNNQVPGSRTYEIVRKILHHLRTENNGFQQRRQRLAHPNLQQRSREMINRGIDQRIRNNGAYLRDYRRALQGDRTGYETGINVDTIGERIASSGEETGRLLARYGPPIVLAVLVLVARYAWKKYRSRRDRSRRNDREDRDGESERD